MKMLKCILALITLVALLFGIRSFEYDVAIHELEIQFIPMKLVEEPRNLDYCKMTLHQDRVLEVSACREPSPLLKYEGVVDDIIEQRSIKISNKKAARINKMIAELKEYSGYSERYAMGQHVINIYLSIDGMTYILQYGYEKDIDKCHPVLESNYILQMILYELCEDIPFNSDDANGFEKYAKGLLAAQKNFVEDFGEWDLKIWSILGEEYIDKQFEE